MPTAQSLNMTQVLDVSLQAQALELSMQQASPNTSEYLPLPMSTK